MKRIDDDVIEDIKRQNDIVDVISNYVSLIKKGKNYVCLCPFHNDTNPSMVVSQEKQIYKCFSCDAGGNVITFVKDFEKISFIEALDKLARNVGIELDIDTQPQKQVNQEYKEYYKLNEEASILYEYLLMENQSSGAIQYLNDRGIDEKLISHFKIGYCTTNNVITNLFKTKEYDLNKAVELGLITLNKNEYQDNYQNRIIYPIIDINNNVLGFTCRALGNMEPKYLNSIESKVFDKSRILYNINNAKDSIKKEKSVYILEGPNDVIAFYKANIENVVCVMGTALTTEHISLLKSLGITQVVLGFDGDEAGQKATYHAIDVLQKARVNIKYLDFDGMDPDEYLNKHGYQKLTDLVKQPKSAIEFKINYEFNQVNVNNYQDKKNVVIKIVNDLNQTLDEFDKEYYYSYLANLSGISYELISSFAMKKQPMITNKPRLDQKIQRVQRNDLDNAAINVLYYVMNDRKYFDVFNKEIGTFINQKYRKLYNIVAAFYLDHNKFDIARINELDIDNELIAELMRIALSYDFDIYNDEELFIDSIETLKLENHYLELERMNEKLKNLSDPMEKAKLSTEILKINEAINLAKQKKFNK